MLEDRLRPILEATANRLVKDKEAMPLSSLRQRAEEVSRTRHPIFFDALKSHLYEPPRIIAEVKRGSPSRGLIRPDLDVALLVSAYEQGGAAAISVLTETNFFYAKSEDFQRAREQTSLPVLRKDFIWDPYQVYQSVAWGADAILLIVRILSDSGLVDLLALAEELGIDALVEVHNEVELNRAVESGAKIIGINNRDLNSFNVSLDTTLRLVTLLMPGKHIVVCESGIHSPDDISRVRRAGVHAFLIGEHLVNSDDPVSALRFLLKGGRCCDRLE